MSYDIGDDSEPPGPEYTPEEIRELEERLKELEREKKERDKSFHQQLSLTFGTLGAIAFAGLVLVLQDPKPFEVQQFKFLTAHQNFDLVTLMLSMVSILALFACMATWFPAAGFIAALSPLGKFGYGCGLLSIVGFVLASLIIVGDVSPEGSEILAAFIVAVIAVLVFAIGETVGWKIVRGWLTIKR